MAKFVDDFVTGKTCVVVGTRPGIIKMSPLITELEGRDVENFTIHAGQHYSDSLSADIYSDLRIPEPDYHIEGLEQAENHGEQTAIMLKYIEQFLLEERPEHVLVCGDANFNLAGALAARKLRLKVGHVEAGLRSDDWRMPEEHNRVMIDHISDYLFAPTDRAKQNAIEDNVRGEVVVTGNTVVDAIERNLDIAASESDILDELGIKVGQYAVFTAHREENVDEKKTLTDLVTVLERVTADGLEVVYPVHPRTTKRFAEFGLKDRLDAIDGLQLTEPLGYLDFIELLSNAQIAITDSGGIQEESCIMGIPCVTIRENTERPETVDVGANVVAGTDPDAVFDAVGTMRSRVGDWENPFGDGTAAEKILDTIHD